MMKAFFAAASEGGRGRQTERRNRDDCVSHTGMERLHYSASLALSVTVTKHNG